MRYRGDSLATGAPGIPPKWTRGNKDGIGTAYSGDSQIWFTTWRGILTEIYYPQIDLPQMRDCQYMVTDGSTFLHEERRHLETKIDRLSEHALGYRISNTDPQGRYRIVKEVLVAPHLPTVLIHTKLIRLNGSTDPLDLFALVAPHLGVGGWGNNGYVVEVAGREILAAEHNGTWLAVGASVPFRRLSVGYVGHSDGWSDLVENYRMDHSFDRATNGNIALTAQLPADQFPQFTLALAFGRGLPHAATALLQALGRPFEDHRMRFIDQWERAFRGARPLKHHSGDFGNLYHASYSIALAHEDKTFAGAFIASMSIPWGNIKGDEDRGGYHLVWTRDLTKTAIGLIATGDTDTALRILIYLSASQEPDGGFPQNFWVTGEPYWSGMQLDEVAFPILLAYRLKRAKALQDFDPYPMVLRAARYLIVHGPATEQERWEEISGYSPSTLAANIAALVAAGAMARERHDLPTAVFLEEYADFLEDHVERWTVTTEGTLLPDVPRHYIRIHPADIHDPRPNEDANFGTVHLRNIPPNEVSDFPAKEIVDAGFLELVRYGIRPADDPIIVDSLKVVDAVLKVDTPMGPVWRRYNLDGYGEQKDGSPYNGVGRGRAWPLLTGERGIYELAAGRSAKPYVQAMERFASNTGLLPEQVWDEPDRPDLHLFLGRATGSATPLMWAHSEYLTLLRSIDDGKPFDIIPEVRKRYRAPRRKVRREIWKKNRQVAEVRKGEVLRIQSEEPFRLHYSLDGWQHVVEQDSRPTGVQIDFLDLPITRDVPGPIRFTFFYPRRQGWEMTDYTVDVRR
ncbi:MAG: glycoside hydrolase family 15 protein [Thermoplasmata archaeon]